jgi:glycosyltransferase involved in cell wall biosynthesis
LKQNLAPVPEYDVKRLRGLKDMYRIRIGDVRIEYPPRDSVALADSIISLLQDKRFAARLGGKARKKIMQRFSAEVTAGSTMRLHETIQKYETLQEPRR